MSENGIAKAEDFRRAVQAASTERVALPSGLVVLLCRPPVFAALQLGREGSELRSRITDADPKSVKQEDILAFTDWISATLDRLFVEPKFGHCPGEITLADVLIDDLKFILRWLRGEIVPTASGSDDLAAFPAGRGASGVSGQRGEVQPMPPK